MHSLGSAASAWTILQKDIRLLIHFFASCVKAQPACVGLIDWTSGAPVAAASRNGV